jgi:hypothetical protein
MSEIARPSIFGSTTNSNRQHRLRVADLDQIGDRLPAHTLRGRVRRDQLGMLGFERPQLVQQGVVLVIADLGIVEHVVAVAVVLELPPQLGGALGGVAGGRGAPGGAGGRGAFGGAHVSGLTPSISLAAGATSRSRS